MIAAEMNRVLSAMNQFRDTVAAAVAAIQMMR